MKNRRTGMRRAFTLVELMIVVGIIIILASLGVPQYVSYRQNAQRAKCISNLRVILLAKMAWRANNPNKNFGSTAALNLSNLHTGGYIRGSTAGGEGNMLTCPSGGSYNLNWKDAEPYLKPTCSKAADLGHVLGKELKN